ncbi:hypothetical protein GCM10023262_11670 [Bartonella pachyuromydis]|uniref:Uncharacterized protein n=2 Tax=Bartonella pachyuromydis TaxID=931097 RepID=A0ABP8VIQ5_9HYPH
MYVRGMAYEREGIARGVGGKDFGLIVRVGKVKHRSASSVWGGCGVVCVCSQICEIVEIYTGVSRAL